MFEICPPIGDEDAALSELEAIETFTQRQLEEIIGVSRQTICVVETSGHMRMQTRRRLEKFLRLDLALLPEPPVEVEAEVGGQGDTPAHGD
ncbi:hypothetical protein [Xanthobacter aminoxidans]|uniref:hypothetical protein n=1 Tax=Xanthobacter aminoxidans TaxID=186280 RepID=UPI002022E0CB|nr:hypothetical protein [Xanthobacter aminoxidans]MCL8385297.1 hypothetical protein [Xanthobacter aminoxidans]